MIESAKALMGERRTYLRIAYLVIAFPLATIYFVVILTGLSVGISLAIVIVGLFVLVLTLLCWLLFARIERGLAIHLLGARIRPMQVPDATPRSPWQRLLKTLGEPVTWKSLAYLLLDFPFGIFSFTLTVTLLATSVSLALSPVIYVVGTALHPQLPRDIHIEMFPGVSINGNFDASVAAGTLVVGAFGVVLLVASVVALNGIGWLWARFAEMMLGVDESRLHLAAAEAEATTQRKRAESADQSRRELIVNASHELRTPVASISAHVESLLKPGRELDDEVRRYLSVVASETDRLGSLVDDLLTLARAEAGELHLDVRPIDVAALVDQVCDALAPLARRERNLNLLYSTAAGLPRAMADRDRLAQVLTNLVRNAVNYTLEGGIISVEAAPNGDFVTVTVSDTGIGMEPQDVAHIFDRFYRADQSRARDSGGSGLGLAIVRDLINAMGATISAQSTPGEGSIFVVRLRREAA